MGSFIMTPLLLFINALIYIVVMSSLLIHLISTSITTVEIEV